MLIFSIIDQNLILLIILSAKIKIKAPGYTDPICNLSHHVHMRNELNPAFTAGPVLKVCIIHSIANTSKFTQQCNMVPHYYAVYWLFTIIRQKTQLTDWDNGI